MASGHHCAGGSEVCFLGMAGPLALSMRQESVSHQGSPVLSARESCSLSLFVEHMGLVDKCPPSNS